MSQQFVIKRRAKRKTVRRGHVLRAAFEAPAGGAVAAADYPGYVTPDEEGSRRTLVSGSLAAGLHLGILGIMVLVASLAPVIDEEMIPVQLLREEPPPPEEPAPAPKALAERRSVNFNPAIQSVTPQIVNPHVIADATPAVSADALQMDAVSSVAAPTQISRSTTVVERVSAVSTVGRASVAAVDVKGVGAPVVRGPTRIDAPVGPSVGPRRIQAASVGATSGTALKIGGNGSSVKEGVLSGRDVVGSPTGAVVVSVDTAVGDGFKGGTGGSGSGVGAISKSQCLQRPEVSRYLSSVRDRTIERWVLPPGVDADRRVTLRFRLDAAGSATSVSLVKAEDNALGASAVDALRSASPFPPMPDEARCLSRVPIIATFSNPVAG